MNVAPRVVDNDKDEITVTLDGREIRGWSYADEAESRVKMRMAREFVEGWYHATERAATIADEAYGEGPDTPYDNGATSDGWNRASQHIRKLIATGVIPIA